MCTSYVPCVLQSVGGSVGRSLALLFDLTDGQTRKPSKKTDLENEKVPGALKRKSFSSILNANHSKSKLLERTTKKPDGDNTLPASPSPNQPTLKRDHLLAGNSLPQFSASGKKNDRVAACIHSLQKSCTRKRSKLAQ